MTKTDIINRTIDKEGGYVNDPLDSGGETNHGITVKVARALGYHDDMSDMPVAFAQQVYQDHYWAAVQGDSLLDVSSELAETVFDASVHVGTRQAAMFLQQAVNALSDEQLRVDGIVGPITKRLTASVDVDTLIQCFSCLRGTFYITLATKRPKDKRFITGWMNRL